jgi:hypothetical protein
MISDDLFLSILAMDSYNRGSTPQIASLGNAAVGNATLDQARDTALASFFAQSYRITVTLH